MEYRKKGNRSNRNKKQGKLRTKEKENMELGTLEKPSRDSREYGKLGVQLHKVTGHNIHLTKYIDLASRNAQYIVTKCQCHGMSNIMKRKTYMTYSRHKRNCYGNRNSTRYQTENSGNPWISSVFALT
jgi:hypothetical protein